MGGVAAGVSDGLVAEATNGLVSEIMGGMTTTTDLGLSVASASCMIAGAALVDPPPGIVS